MESLVIDCAVLPSGSNFNDFPLRPHIYDSRRERSPE
jgi:hypothetical protein